MCIGLIWSICQLVKTVLCYRYEAGDHVAVYPVNDSEIVDAIGKRLNIDLDTIITLTNVDGMGWLLIIWTCFIS